MLPGDKTSPPNSTTFYLKIFYKIVQVQPCMQNVSKNYALTRGLKTLKQEM